MSSLVQVNNPYSAMNIASVKIKTSPILMMRLSLSQTIQAGSAEFMFISSEGALYVILPYDYPEQHPLFEHTPVLNNNFKYWCHDDFVDYDFYED